MKNNIILILIISTGLILSCKKDKNVYTEDITLNVAENPVDSLEIGQVTATTEKSYITYTLLAESIEGAITVDSKTGKLFVKDPTIFNYEYNAIITAKVECSNGKNEAVSHITINVTDVYETPAVIGEFKEGGVVFWVDPIDNSMGMVCSSYDIATSAGWGCWDIYNQTPELEGADGTAIGTGYQNTLDIVSGCSTSGIAADLCNNLTLNGYNDWALPSIDEIQAINTTKSAINSTSVSYGGVAIDDNTYYWTSTEYNAQRAYNFYFLIGQADTSLKVNGNNVRAVRSF